MTSIARWLDDQPPSIEETVLALHEALFHYVQMLRDLRCDELNEGKGDTAEILRKDIEAAETFLRDLDHWGLCPDLHGLIKARP
jgi:hypothetical protein